MKTQLHLQKIELSLNLGWFDHERATPQKVLLDLQLQFHQPPKGCVTDDLKDTYCYDTLIQALIAATCDKEFKLIEYLAAFIDDFVRQTLPKETLIRVSIHKDPRAYIPSLTGGVVFSYGDDF